MDRRFARLSLSRKPVAGTVDAIVLGYLQATSGDCQFPNERYSLAATTFWLPYAYQAANYSALAIRQEVQDSILQGQKQRDHIRGIYGPRRSLPEPRSLGLHLPDPLALTELPLSGQLSESKEFRIRLGEAGNDKLDSLCFYLNRLSTSERRLKLMQALRGFWFPFACQHYGLKGQSLAEVGEAAVSLLETQFEHLRTLLPQATTAPIALAALPQSPAPCEPQPPEEISQEEPDDEFSDYDADHDSGNGQVIDDPALLEGLFENMLN